MEKLRSLMLMSFFAALTLSVYQCGGSDSGEEEEEPAADAESDDVATAEAASSGITDSLNSSTESANQNISALIRAGVKNQSVPLDSTMTIDCPSSGSMTIVTTGTATIEGETASLDMDSITTFDSCAFDASVEQDDGTTCDFSGSMDGEMSCSIEGTSESLDFACDTGDDICAGLTVTINSETHTGGMDISLEDYNGSAGGDINFEGDVCIDGTTFDIQELSETEVPVGELTCS